MLIPFSVTMKVIKALEECEINYLIGGSLGSNTFRYTGKGVGGIYYGESGPYNYGNHWWKLWIRAASVPVKGVCCA